VKSLPTFLSATSGEVDAAVVARKMRQKIRAAELGPSLNCSKLLSFLKYLSLHCANETPVI